MAKTTAVATPAAATTKPTITITSVLADLSNGMERKEIGAKYGLNFTQTTQLFKHEKLKGKKVKKAVQPAFELVDDTESDVAPLQQLELPLAEAIGEPSTPLNIVDDTVQANELVTAPPVAEEGAW